MVKILIVLAAVLVAALADNSACPHPDEATRLLHAQRVVTERPEDGRRNIRIEVLEQIIRDQPITCIALISSDSGSAPAYLGAGKNRDGGLSVVMHSKERELIDASFFVYTSEPAYAAPVMTSKALKNLPIEISRL